WLEEESLGQLVHPGSVSVRCAAQKDWIDETLIAEATADVESGGVRKLNIHDYKLGFLLINRDNSRLPRFGGVDFMPQRLEIFLGGLADQIGVVDHQYFRHSGDNRSIQVPYCQGAKNRQKQRY